MQTNYRTPPRTNARIFLLAPLRAAGTVPTQTAPRYFVGRLPATRYCGAAKTRARYRTADTETSILLPSPTGLAGEAPDNSRKIPLGKSEVCNRYQIEKKNRNGM